MEELLKFVFLAELWKFAFFESSAFSLGLDPLFIMYLANWCIDNYKIARMFLKTFFRIVFCHFTAGSVSHF
jgi:hypothetical protein